MGPACGGAVGPGTGIQLQHAGSPHVGRILFIGHYGAYGQYKSLCPESIYEN